MLGSRTTDGEPEGEPCRPSSQPSSLMSTMPQPELAVQDEALEVSAELIMSPAVTEAASPDDQGDADKHAPLNPAWIMKAKSTKRKLTSAVWDHYQQLTDECPMKTKGFTHVCTLPLGDDVSCNMVRGCAGFPRYSF